MTNPRVHSRTLFHFTNQQALVGILQSNFRSSFAKERIQLENGALWDYWVPMVCFCDIPLHLISDHIDHYGQYGIGLSREWAIRRGLNLVLYYQSQSALFEQFNSMMSIQHKDVEDLAKLSLTVNSVREAYFKNRYILQYYKSWVGHDFKSRTDRCFYDEREWRYVPVREPGYEAIFGDKEDFADRKEEYYGTLEDPCLVFEPNDINYVVLHREAERYEVVQKLREIKGRYSYRDVETLVSKIITVEQIKNDV